MHRTQLVLEKLDLHGIQDLQLLARFPDLNPNEHAWDLLGNTLADHLPYPENIGELSELLRILWQQIPSRRLTT
jgi:hypothetical protein